MAGRTKTPAQSSHGTQGKVRLRDVAREVGVSIATVSRVLNNHNHVAEELRARVLQAISDLGYVPNTAARALVTRRSRTIGALVPTIEYPGFATTVQAMQRRLSDCGFTMLQATSEHDLAREFEQARVLTMRGVDGLMLIGASHNEELYDWLNARDVPFVSTWVADSKGHGPAIGFDNAAATARMADYLLDLGHTRISMIVGNTQSNDRAAERLAGVRQALAARGLALHSERQVGRPYKIGEGRVALRTLLEQPQRPTAVICSNDILAFGALAEASRMGLAVPGDVSVVGFDDADFAQELTPPLTTVRVEAAQIGTLAAEFLLDRIDGRPTLEKLEIPVTIVVRQSAAPPRESAGARPAKRAAG